jgi:hypothetical protein
LANQVKIKKLASLSNLERAREDRTLDLSKKPRWRETLIQSFLFFSGALSILTTIGIVIVLSRESLNFFTRQMNLLSSPSDGLPSGMRSKTSSTRAVYPCRAVSSSACASPGRLQSNLISCS